MDAIQSVWNWIVDFWTHWYGKLSITISTAGGAMIWYWKYKKAKAEAQTAEIRHSRESLEWNKMQREEKIEDFKRQIEKAEREASKGKPRPVYFSEVKAAEGEDAELVQEAFERLKENRKQDNHIERFRPPWQ